MKAIGGLFDKIASRENLGLAFWRTAKGKRSRRDVTQFSNHLNTELNLIIAELRGGSYVFSPYRQFFVRDTKSRLINAPAFRDRVTHHAMINVLGPVFEKGALPTSFACRKGRGQHAALAQAEKWTRRRSWYGKMDVEKFYDSVDHEILFRLLTRRFREKRVLRLFDSLLSSYQSSPGKGLPIGALTSQYLGNFYLDEFDRRMKATELFPKYVRYMDDTVIWTRESTGQHQSVCEEILSDLKLKLKNHGEWNRSEQGLPFLGFVIYPNRIRLNREGRRRLRRKCKVLDREWNDQKIGARELQDRSTALFAHASFANDVAWRNTVISFRNFGEELEPQPRDSRRILEQPAGALPLCGSEQEPSRQPQQEPGVPGLSGSRHGGNIGNRVEAPDICQEHLAKKGAAEAPIPRNPTP